MSDDEQRLFEAKRVERLAEECSREKHPLAPYLADMIRQQHVLMVSLQEQKHALDRVERTLFGEDKSGNTGLVKRQENTHKRMKVLEWFVPAAVGAGFVVGVAWEIFKKVGPAIKP